MLFSVWKAYAGYSIAGLIMLAIGTFFQTVGEIEALSNLWPPLAIGLIMLVFTGYLVRLMMAHISRSEARWADTVTTMNNTSQAAQKERDDRLMEWMDRRENDRNQIYSEGLARLAEEQKAISKILSSVQEGLSIRIDTVHSTLVDHDNWEREYQTRTETLIRLLTELIRQTHVEEKADG
jgi:hypothetical protein